MKVLLARVLVIDILKAFVWQKPMQIISKQTEKLIVGFQLKVKLEKKEKLMSIR